MNEYTIKYKVGPGFLGCLTLLFVALKLTGHCTWSWIWVFCPLWLPWAFMLGLFLLVFLIGLIGLVIAALLEMFRPQRIK